MTDNDMIDAKLREGHARGCDTQEGGSCDCGFEAWLYEAVENLGEALAYLQMGRMGQGLPPRKTDHLLRRYGMRTE